MSRFWFSPAIPAEILAAIKPLFESLEWLLPAWVQKCNVFWCDDGGDGNVQANAGADSLVSYPYRHVQIRILPSFLNADAGARRQMAIHELLHASVNVLADYARQEIKRLIPEDGAPKYRGALLDELEARGESVVQDLTAIIDAVAPFLPLPPRAPKKTK